jgi:hypothetical protein
MDTAPLILTDLPELTDESAGQLLDWLNALVMAFENRYDTQLRRYYQVHAVVEPPEPGEPREPREDDLFEGFDEIPF